MDNGINNYIADNSWEEKNTNANNKKKVKVVICERERDRKGKHAAVQIILHQK